MDRIKTWYLEPYKTRPSVKIIVTTESGFVGTLQRYGHGFRISKSRSEYVRIGSMHPDHALLAGLI